MDLQRIQKLNAWWQAAWDARQKKGPKKPRVCKNCGLEVNSSTHNYSDLGGYECYEPSRKPASKPRRRLRRRGA